MATMKQAMKKWEGSKADERIDRKMAKQSMHKAKVRSAASKAMGKKY